MTLGQADIARLVVPGTAAHRKQAFHFRFLAILHWRWGIFVVQGTRPFQHIAQHVAQTKIIVAKTAHRRGVHVSITASHRGPADKKPFAVQISGIGIAAALVGIVAPIAAGRRARSRRIFPLGFSRQPVAMPGLLRQPRSIIHCILPTDIDHRSPVAAPTAIIGQRPAGGGGKPIIFLKRHLMASDSKRLFDPH